MRTDIKYPWQQTILDAYTASAQDLPAKITIAEQAIAERMNDSEDPDTEEKIALRDAQNAIRVLSEEINSRSAAPKLRMKTLSDAPGSEPSMFRP